MNFIGLAEYYNCRPSAFITADEYTKYCLDEACAYIKLRIKDGEKPRFGAKAKLKKKYTSFSALYDDILN